MNDSGSERRMAERVPSRCRVAYRVLREGGGEKREEAGETLNLSASGLCLRTARPLRRDDHVALEIALDGLPDPVMAVGRVVWCDESGGAARVGICFSWLREEDRRSLAILNDYVREWTRPSGD